MALEKLTLPRAFSFTYRDGDGVVTCRTVMVASIGEADGRTYLDGVCETEQSERSFRADRVDGLMTDVETGELVEVARLLSDVPERAVASYTLRRFFDDKPRAPKEPVETVPAVLFTGFAKAKRAELEAVAAAAGWQVRTKLGPTLDYLVCGPNAGPAKQAQAEALGITALDAATFSEIVARP